MIIRQVPLPTSKYASKCPYSMSPEFLVIHNTANDASAANEISYMQGASSVSFHYAVDDKEAIQGLPLDRNGWHAGDGANGRGNRKGIGIEICYSKSGGARFDQAEKNGALLAAKLLHARGWGLDRVKKHQDFSGKHCPHRTLDYGWQRFLNMVQKELTPKPAPSPEPKITYASIPKKSIELVRNANLWNFNFTDWTKAKPVNGYKKGDKIDNIVAIATNALGAKYYVTEYSFKNKVTNGFNINDAKDYTPPVTPPKPPVEPPKTEPELPPAPTEPPKTDDPEPVPEVPDYAKENNTMLKWLVELVKSLLDWIKGVK